MTHVSCFISFLIVFGSLQPVLAQDLLSQDEFLKQVLNNNIEIQSATEQVSGAKARASGVRLPPPEVSVNQMDMAGGDSAQGWQVSQKIPFPTKVRRDLRARKLALKASETSQLAARQEILAQAQYMYFLVWADQERLRIAQDKRRLLNRHLKIARALAQSDTVARVHVLKIEAKLQQLQNDIDEISQSLAENVSRAAVYVDRDPARFRFTAAEPQIVEVSSWPAAVDTPQVQAMKSEVKSLEALKQAKRSEWLPDFKVTYSEMEATRMYPENSELMLGVSLPFVYFWQPRAQTAEAHSKQRQKELLLSSRTRNIEAEMVSLKEKLKSLRSQMNRTKTQVLPLAVRRQKLFQNISPRDMSSLQEHLDTSLAVPETESELLNLRSKYEHALSLLFKYKPLRLSSRGTEPQ